MRLQSSMVVCSLPGMPRTNHLYSASPVSIFMVAPRPNFLSCIFLISGLGMAKLSGSAFRSSSG